MTHVDDIWPGLLKQALAQHEVSGGQGSLRQIAGCHVKLDGSVEQFLMNQRRKLSPVYASAELLWYLKRTFSVEMIAAYAPSYVNYADDGIAYGAYGGRIGYGCDMDQLLGVIKLLKERQQTKKAVVSLWRPSDLQYQGWYKDIPCTISWQFLVQQGKLDMIVSMRSNDLWRGFLYDVYVNTVIHRYVAARVGLDAGTYHHTSGSMHLYNRDVKKAEEATESTKELGTCYVHRRPQRIDCDWNEKQLAAALNAEELLRRTKRSILYQYQFMGLPDTLTDALACCERRFVNEKRHLSSPALQYGLDQWVTTSTTA